MADELGLIGRLATALEARDLAALASGVALALRPSLPVVWVEVGYLVDGELIGATAGSDGRPPALAPKQSSGEALLASQKVAAVWSLPGPRAVEASPEAQRARQAGARGLLFLPALVHGACIGQAVVATRAGIALSSAALEAMSRVVSAGVANLRVLTRLAGVSRRAYRENRHLREDLQHATAAQRLIGSAPALRQAIAAADAVAPFDTPVLLRGETGTGKELLAHHIHERSLRSRRPFLKLNCGAIPDGLVESELFGHERGAFTGAIRRHEGIFERAGGGTVLLDEIGELPLSSQVKILRVLQSGEYQRVGGKEPLRTDARVIAATHRRLEEMVEVGTFRADLFYRLDVFPIEVPPLRERAEDIALLAAGLAQRISARLGRPAPALDRGALARLEAYSWPGNVRELENVLERALILSPGPTLEIPHLQGGSTPRRLPERRESLAIATRRHIEATLHACGGKIYGADGAAARLGLPPSTLQSKMARLGVAGGSRRTARAR